MPDLTSAGVLELAFRFSGLEELHMDVANEIRQQLDRLDGRQRLLSNASAGAAVPEAAPHRCPKGRYCAAVGFREAARASMITMIMTMLMTLMRRRRRRRGGGGAAGGKSGGAGVGGAGEGGKEE